jgi:N,N-dimethylformamidase beta subunit-like, C-terminal
VRKTTLHGYSDRPSAAPGERIRFFVSAEEPGRYRADVVRLVNGDTNPAGPGFKEVEVATAVSGDYAARFQPIHPGSHVVVDDGGRLHPPAAFALHTYLFATTPAKGEQGILTRWSESRKAGYALAVDRSAGVALRLGDGNGRVIMVATGKPLLGSVWYSVAAGFDPATRRAWVSQAPVINSVNSLFGPVYPIDGEVLVEGEADHAPADGGVRFVMAGWVEGAEGGRTIVGGHFNGKLDRPRIYGRDLAREEVAALHAGGEPGAKGLLARWDFAVGISEQGIATDRVADVSGSGLDGACENLPMRAATGFNWRGREENFTHAPAEYGAIHFHDDDLDDCRWQADFELVIPDGMKSDVYAARLRLSESEEHVPFFVLPPRGHATAKILLLMPTASYLAYANDHIVAEVPVGQAIVGHTPVLDENDFYLCRHPELGLSTYDHHTDGSGVCFSSWRRPILTMRPKDRHGTGSVWQFPADLHLVDWLNAKGFAYDVATDHDLESEGVELLRRYRTVLTGTHPEYYSTHMLDAFEGYLASGGRAMYLGANGFYWVTSFHPDKPWVIEVRKAESGSRAWQASPGEYYHATSGERGGIWRNRARPPQKIFGVGFTSEGFERSSHYLRMPDGRDPRAAWIFEGVERPERIGDFGLVGGGAAGYEIDRYEIALGTPPNALLLASSEGHSDDYPHVVEEIMFNFPGLGGTQDPQVRADVVYFATPRGGAVFSVGSIAWCGSLAHSGYENDVSRITANVLRRFTTDVPLP